MDGVRVMYVCNPVAFCHILKSHFRSYCTSLILAISCEICEKVVICKVTRRECWHQGLLSYVSLCGSSDAQMVLSFESCIGLRYSCGVLVQVQSQ